MSVSKAPATSRSSRVLLAAMASIAMVTFVAVRLASAPDAAPREYVGQESCMASGCHADAYSGVSSFQGAAPFRETMHQRIHLRPTPETVVIDRFFDNDTTLRYYEPRVRQEGKDTLLVRLSKSADRRTYFVQLRFSGGGDSTPRLPVAYTYGGNGWIQRFLVEAGGVLAVAPFQFLLPGYRNRVVEGGRIVFIDMARWYTIDGTTGLARFFPTSSNQFRLQSWDNNCASCHVNGFGLTKTIAGTDTSWQARWVGSGSGDSALRDENIRVGCESCHGPGSEHVADPRADNIISPSTFPQTPAGTEMKYDLCNQCHNRMKSTKGIHPFPFDDSLGVPYVPGGRLRDFIQDPYGAMSLWSDGTTSSAHHQQGQDATRSGHYRSNVFQNGCWSCHLVHSTSKAGLPFQLDRNWYSLKRGEGCLNGGCHASFGDTGTSPIDGRVVNLHTQHSQSVSRCVNCHFTDAITIGFDTASHKQLYEFSDHSFRVLRPNLTLENATRGIVGMINTCAAGCHRNGRGSRNSDPLLPAAPAFGTVDASEAKWNERSDLDLADSLWRHYQRMYARYVTGVRTAPATSGTVAIERVSPNPSRGAVTIEVSIPRASDVNVSIYDLSGRLVRTLAAARHEPGRYAMRWEGDDEMGTGMVSGVYIVRLAAGGSTVATRVMIER